MLQQLSAAIWRCCNGCANMAAVGIEARAQAQPEGVTWLSFGGRDRMAAAGDRTPAAMQLEEATWQY